MSAAADRVQPYAVGICFASVCADAELSPAEVERELDRLHPTGLSHGWMVRQPTFRTGEPNPCECNTDPSRKHWLLEC